MLAGIPNRIKEVIMAAVKHFAEKPGEFGGGKAERIAHKLRYKKSGDLEQPHKIGGKKRKSRKRA
jgi:hypothetical protein